MKKGFTPHMSSQRRLGSCWRIEDSSLRWSNRKGFTLIELSIVLVIIGLIVGGVLVGQDLIKAAELRKVIGQVESYKAAVNTFRLKYNGLPGDLNNATTFFTGTANGDGNKQITYPGGGAQGEWLRAWQQLGLASLIDGTYTGLVAGSEPYVRIGENTPESAIKGAGYSVLYATGHATQYNRYGNFFSLGAERDSSYTANGGVSGEDAYVIDSKMDDGTAITGKVLTIRGTDKGSGCVDGSNIYLATETDKNCWVQFHM